jgi:ribonuclease T2
VGRIIKRHSIAALLALAAAVAGGPPARAEPAAGDFDYYVLALSWSPTWCEAEVAAGDAPEQCDPRRDLGFTLHGLWPQYDGGGWPEYCDTTERDPKRDQSANMADIMGSGGLAWYQWKKHGRCSGLPAGVYFALSRLAYAFVKRPGGIGGATMTPEAVERAFIKANPDLHADDLVVSCAENKLREVRICLTKDLEPRGCAPDVLADACRSSRAISVPPIP